MPGMPIAAGDPGVFLCKIDPLERDDLARKPANAGVDIEQKRALSGVWLVLTLCQHCNARTGRYCHSHDMRMKAVRPALTPNPRGRTTP